MTRLNLFFVIAFCSLSNICFAQADLQQANNLYEQFDFKAAADLYKKVLDDDKRNAVALERIADCYRQIGDNQKATFWYPKAIKANPKNDLLKYYHARCLMGLGKYENALELFQTYKTTTKGAIDSRTDRFIVACRNVKQFYTDSLAYDIKWANFSSPQSDLAPTFWKNDQTLVFSSFRPKKGGLKEETYADIFFTEKGNPLWTLPAPMVGRPNNPYHEGPVTFNAFGNVMYFTRNVPRKKAKHSGVAHLQIFESRWENGRWTEGTVLPFCNDEYSYGHPSLSYDGKTIYFVSDMPFDSEGGKDIWKSEFENGRWTEPSNLGASINTRGDEMFPYIHRDGSLYFSSDGREGLGGFDVFMATPFGEDWNVENMKYPINTSKDDLAISLSSDKAVAYLTSNRRGNEDIFIVTLPNRFHINNETLPAADNANNVPTRLTGNQQSNTASKASTQYVPIETTSINSSGIEAIYTEKEAEVIENPAQFIEINPNLCQISGIVVDEITGKGIPNASIRIADNNNSKNIIEQHTDTNGTFNCWVEKDKNYTISKMYGNIVEDYRIVSTIPNGELDKNGNVILYNKKHKEDQSEIAKRAKDAMELYAADAHSNKKTKNETSLLADASPIYKTTPAINPKEVVFRVQIGAFQQVLAPRSYFFNRVKDRKIESEVAPTGLVRYTVGNYDDLSIARVICQEMKNRGYKNAFVAGYISGTRYEGDIEKYLK